MLAGGRGKGGVSRKGGWGKGGKDKRGYESRGAARSELALATLARRLLIAMWRRSGPAVWDRCRMKVLAAALPDAIPKARPIEDALAGDARHKFGMSL